MFYALCATAIFLWKKFRGKRVCFAEKINDKKRISPEETAFLKKLNSFLAVKEKELREKSKIVFEQYEKRLKKNGGDLDDYEIDAVFEYWKTGMFQI